MRVFNLRLAQRAVSFMLLAALFATTSAVATFAQTRRTRRRAPRLGTYTRPTTTINNNLTYRTLEAETTIRVRMDQELSSAEAHVGDRFTTTVVDPVYADGVEVIPAGSKIAGRVTAVERAGRKSKAGTLSVAFTGVRFPSGTLRPLNGSLTDLSGGRAINADREGQVEGGSSTKRNAVFIGGGAATGALIGAIAGGGKGAGIGAGIGAGLGVAGSIFSKGEEAVVRPGTEFGVIINRSISLPAYR